MTWNWRRILQALGDDEGKIKSNNKLYYVEHLITLVEYLVEDDAYVIIPDVRYPFEIDYVRDNLAPVDTLHTIRVNRVAFESDLTPEQKQHESEILLDNYRKFSYHIDNTTLEHLEDKTNIICDNIVYNIHKSKHNTYLCKIILRNIHI